MEASVARTLGRHVVEVRYTGLKGVQDVLPGLLSRYTFNYPSQAAVVHWNARLPKGFLARTRFGVTQRRARDPYTVVDAYLAWSEHSLRPFLQVTNLMDTTYQEILGVPMPGMGVMGGVEWRLGGGR